MPAIEPIQTAFLLTVVGALILVSILVSRTSQKLGVPVALLFLVVGMAAGSQGLGRIAFDDYGLAFRWGTLALALILFDGGLNTDLASARTGLKPAIVLSTVGVLITAGAVAGAAHYLGFAWPEALLLGAIVSSTDAAAVFSVLRGSGLHLERRVAATLELESGLNDPLAVSLTLVLARALVGGHASLWLTLGTAAVQLVIGGLFGLAIGYAGRLLLQRIQVPAGGLFPVLTIAIALVAFGLPTLLGGSGFLAVFVAAVVLGNGPITYRSGIIRVHDALAWLGQVTMFLLLGLLVMPSRLLAVTWVGLALGLFLALIARPVAVILCLLPFRYSPREVAFVGWVGLRGAVPIILAIFPVLAHAPGAMRIFDVVFFVVVVSALVPGGTVRALTRFLKLDTDAVPTPQAIVEITTMRPLRGDLLAFHINAISAVAGATIADLPFPPGAAATLIVRGDSLIAPRGKTTLEPGDHVYVFCNPEDRALVQLLFGSLQST